MNRKFKAKPKLWVIIPVIAVLLTAEILVLSTSRTSSAAPELMMQASPINAGCYRATRTTCKIHVDPFTITKSTGPALFGFQLYANTSLIYDFKTDVSNPPISSYSPSLVRQDFAATCGQSFDISLVAKDADSPNYLTLGVTPGVTCPLGEYDSFLPIITR